MQEKWTKSINRLFFIMVLSAMVAPVLLAGVLANLNTEWLLVVSQLLYLVPVLIYIAVKRIRPWEWMPFTKIPLSAFLMLLLFSVLLLPLVIFINLISMLFVTNQVAEVSTGLTNNSFWLNLLLFAVMPAVSEEFMFRGIFYHAYRKKGVWMGALASGMVFALLHLNFNQFSYALVLGVIFCLVVEATGSIFGSMTVHFMINGWNVALMALQKPMEEMAQSLEGQAQSVTLTEEQLLISLGVYGVFALIATVLAACALVWIAKRCGRQEHMKWCFTRHEAIPGEKKTFLTPCWIVGCCICVGYMLLSELL